MNGQRVFVAGIPVVRSDLSAAVSLLTAAIERSDPCVFALVNGFSASLRRRDAAYADLLRSPQVVPLPDGIPLSLGARLTGQGHVGRSPGPDLLEAAADEALERGFSFFLLGGGPGAVEQLSAALVARHPGLCIAGVATPPFGEWTEQQSRDLVAAIHESGAQIVWLGVSAPKQETWAFRWRREIGRPIVCVGAAFDFLSGRKPRAPIWMRRAGLEWLFRLISEPGRLWKRYLAGNAVFLWDLVRFGRKPAP